MFSVASLKSGMSIFSVSIVSSGKSGVVGISLTVFVEIAEVKGVVKLGVAVACCAVGTV